MCFDWIEIFITVILTSPHLKLQVCWKDVLHQPVNIILTFRKKIISSILPKILNTVSPVDHKQHLNDVTLRNARKSWRSYTAGTTLLFTNSVNNTNITEHIFQCVTVLNQDTLQLFPSIPLQQHIHTQDCISQTVRSELSRVPKTLLGIAYYFNT